MSAKCNECGKMYESGGPPSSHNWCSDACAGAWAKSHPEDQEGWIAVGDLDAVQRAELDGILGLGGKA